MPNWTENEMTISGPNVQKVLNAIRSEAHEDEDARLLDFDKIIPYPEQYRELDQRAHEYQEKFRTIEKNDPERKTKLEALATEYGIDPGAPWIKDGFNSGGYEWRCSNWGTKWNATHVSLTLRNGTATDQTQKKIQCVYCQTVHSTERMTVLICQQCGSPLPDVSPQEAYLEFDTAWSPPIPVIEKLATLFPDHEFQPRLLRRRDRVLRAGALDWRTGTVPLSGCVFRPARWMNKKEKNMSYTTEHQRMKPVLDLARKLDIATNHDLNALFEAGNGGFQVWCTPWDHPAGWSRIAMRAGAFSKPCEFVGSVYWKWEEEKIVALEIETTAYALADQKPDEYCNLQQIPAGFERRTIFNRDADIAWLKEKVEWLFAEAGVLLLPIHYEQAALSELGPYFLAHYVSDGDEYVVILSPELDPQEFCRPGYQFAHTMEIWTAGDFPADVILRPEQTFLEPDTEPDEGPLVEQYENASRLHDDDWLEAGFEERISGAWDE